MLANFKKTILFSVFASTVAVCAVGFVGAVGVAQAAPDFQNIFDGPYKPLALAKEVATSVSGNIGMTAKSKQYASEDVSEFTDAHQTKMPEALAAIDYDAQDVKFAMQDAGEFTNVLPPKFLDSAGNVIHTAQAKPIIGAPSPAVPVVAIQADHRTLAELFPTPVMAMPNGNHLKIQSTATCRALDAKLDRRHLPSLREHAILAHHGCGIRSTGSIES
jgi:hypothetical protein